MTEVTDVNRTSADFEMMDLQTMLAFAELTPEGYMVVVQHGDLLRVLTEEPGWTLPVIVAMTPDGEHALVDTRRLQKGIQQ